MLATVALVFRPLTLSELGAVIPLSEDLCCNVEALEDIARRSGSFLSVRGEKSEDKIVSFVHQSARDYIVKQAKDIIFPEGLPLEHQRLARACMQRLCEPDILHKNMLQVQRAGTRRTELDRAYVDTHLSAKATYTCVFWAAHSLASEQALRDGDHVHAFLQRYFLYWFETLSWLGKAFDATSYMMQLGFKVDKVRAVDQIVNAGADNELARSRSAFIGPAP